MLRFFNEPFQIIHSANDQQQLLNPWERKHQVVASIDYAKQDGVRERVWQQPWDLIMIDEAHKCSAYTKRASGRENKVQRTKRYQLAERLSEQRAYAAQLAARIRREPNLTERAPEAFRQTVEQLRGLA